MIEIEDPNSEINEENDKVNAVPESLSNKNSNQFFKETDIILENSTENAKKALFNDCELAKINQTKVSFIISNEFFILIILA